MLSNSISEFCSTVKKQYQSISIIMVVYVMAILVFFCGRMIVQLYSKNVVDNFSFILGFLKSGTKLYMQGKDIHTPTTDYSFSGADFQNVF